MASELCNISIIDKIGYWVKFKYDAIKRSTYPYKKVVLVCDNENDTVAYDATTMMNSFVQWTLLPKTNKMTRQFTNSTRAIISYQGNRIFNITIPNASSYYDIHKRIKKIIKGTSQITTFGDNIMIDKILLCYTTNHHVDDIVYRDITGDIMKCVVDTVTWRDVVYISEISYNADADTNSGTLTSDRDEIQSDDIYNDTGCMSASDDDDDNIRIDPNWDNYSLEITYYDTDLLSDIPCKKIVQLHDHINAYVNTINALLA